MSSVIGQKNGISEIEVNREEKCAGIGQSSLSHYAHAQYKATIYELEQARFGGCYCSVGWPTPILANGLEDILKSDQNNYDGSCENICSHSKINGAEFG